MRTFNLITSFNGVGLEKDTGLLKQLLESHGHSVTCTQFNGPSHAFKRFDVNIFLEVVNQHWFNWAGQNWLVPNSEWWLPEWNPCLPKIDKVLCKTEDCHRIWAAKVGAERTVYTGFEANDRFRADVERKPVFLHLAGKSHTKNTAAVLSAWHQFNLPYPLVVVAFHSDLAELCIGVPNVTHFAHLSDEQIAQTLNECRYHIMPSMYEGYGHAIHEALGCKGVLLTTDAPPMNEIAGIDKRLLIPVSYSQPRFSITYLNEVLPEGVRDAVQRAVALSEVEVEQVGEAARTAFLADREFFRAKFAEVVK